jgi:hypothetical protein
MTRHLFSRPVAVLVGLGFPRQIDGPAAGLAFLDTQPGPMRDLAFEATRHALEEALCGAGDTEEARDVLCAFARRRGMLIEDGLPESAVIAAATPLAA